MVNLVPCLTSWIIAQAAAPNNQAKAETLFERLSPVERAVVLMALLGILILGAALVGLVYLGGWHLRRIARKRLPPSASRDEQWYHKPLVPRDPELPTGEPE
jgi:hypothetical protein